ncbi:Meiosis regulator and mRNA stability factor 1 [Linum perenne]
MIAKKALLPLKPLPSPPSILISYFSTSAPPPQQYQSRRHQQEEDSRSVRVSVWWDFENCHLPAGANVFKVAQMITAAVRANGMKGPVQITAFGDVLQLSRSNQEALSSTGINMTHVPNGGKNSTDRSLLVDLMYWVSQNPPPAHLFLISSDRDFASTLHRLRMNNYNILLASNESARSVLCSAASIMWRWNELVKGENLIGKYFNQPPDGPYGSWYGHYKLPLEDPFAGAAEPPPPKVEECVESEPRIRPIPKGVMRQIRHVLSSYPDGLSITELRSELQKRNVGIDKRFYGHVKFSTFLFAMPEILKLENKGDGLFRVHLVDDGNKGLESPEVLDGKGHESPEVLDGKGLESPGHLLSTAIEMINNGGPLPSSSSKRGDRNGEGENLEKDISLAGKEVQESGLRPGKAVNVDCKNPNGKESTYPVGEKVVRKANARETDNQMSQVRKEEHVPDAKECPVNEQVSEKLKAEETDEQSAKEHKSEGGVFKTIWRNWFGSSKKETEGTLEMPNDKLGEEAVDKKNPSNGEKLASSRSPPSVDSNLGSKIDRISEASSENLTEKSAISSETSSENLSRSLGLFSRIKNWWNSRGTSLELVDKQSSETIDQKNGSTLNLELFSKDSFWSEIEPFIRTQKGSLAITESKSRDQMATNLQKEGPLVLKSLKENDLLLLVDILISEKKWVEERPSEASPFKVTLSVDNNAPRIDPRTPNGLRSLFLKQAAPPRPASKPQSFERSRSEILIDCRNLVQEIVKVCPNGYNMGAFRKLFLDRYGYKLDVQKLGYQKLASLLTIMPGVKVDASYIFPNVTKSYNNDTSDRDSSLKVPKKDSESDSPWDDELGPADDNSSTVNTSTKSPPLEAGTKGMIPPSYEPLSDDDESSSSDSEVESLAAIRQQADQVKKCSAGENDSSLLEVLAIWDASKNDETLKDDDDDVDAEEEKKVIHSAAEGLQQQAISSLGRGRKGEAGYGNPPRPGKSYSFVEDAVEEEKDRLIGGILSTLSKSSESRMHN